jgi:hypothetical protein
MATLNFDESIVLILFAQAVGDLQPSQSDLVQFDADLQSTFGGKLLAVLGAEGMDPNVHNRSAVLGCRPFVPGNTADSQLRNACRYVLQAQQQLGPQAIAAFQALQGFKAAAARASRPRKKQPKTGKRASAQKDKGGAK